MAHHCISQPSHNIVVPNQEGLLVRPTVVEASQRTPDCDCKVPSSFICENEMSTYRLNRRRPRIPAIVLASPLLAIAAGGNVGIIRLLAACHLMISSLV